MKIAILTSFRKMPDSYSLVNDVRDQVKMLKGHGHEVVFFAQEGCTGEGIDCEMKAILPHFKLEKNVEDKEIKKKLIEIFNKELKDFDIIITHDLLYLRSFYTYRKAIMECNVPGKWLHWAHSRIENVDESLKMSKSKYIYMNYKDVADLASNIGVGVDDVRVVFNDKDPALFFGWHEITKRIAKKYDLLNVDVMQTFPLCSTRMDAKGIDYVIKSFGKLKKIGNKVLLIVVNSNARKKKDEIESKLKLAESCGLTRDEVVFTSTVDKDLEGGVPRAVVRDLMQISNLFIFPTLSEVCPNVLLEAAMSKNLLVLNKSLPLLFDFAVDGQTCLSYNFGSLSAPGYRYRNEEGYMTLAKEINEHLRHSKIIQQFQKTKKECNINAIYRNQLEPILYEKF